MIEWPSPHSSEVPKILRDESLCRTSDFEQIRDDSNIFGNNSFFDEDFDYSMEYTWPDLDASMNLTDYEEEFKTLTAAGWDHVRCKQWMERRIQNLN